jgi:hypothetical protein
METKLIWKSKFFKNRYEIFSHETGIGELQKSSWSRTSSGELNGKKYIFDTRGFLNKETQIIDLKDNSVIGKILFSNWRTKTTIIYRNKEYIFRYDNILNTKWSISDESGVLVNFQSFISDGDINSSNSDEVLILAGLFIRNYIKQNSE